MVFLDGPELVVGLVYLVTLDGLVFQDIRVIVDGQVYLAIVVTVEHLDGPELVVGVHVANLVCHARHL